MGALVDDVIPGAWALMTAEPDGGREPVRRTRLECAGEDGRVMHLGLAASALRDADGQSIGHVLIFQDVTSVVEMETELTRSERLAAVGEMAAKIAHEIRNPLAAISGSVQILRDDVGRPDAQDPSRLMGIVVREADRLSGLITDFLDYARPQPAKRERLDLVELCEEVLEILRGACPEHVTLALAGDGSVPLQGDGGQLRQLLWNLCLNGIEAMPDGGRLSVTVRGGGAGVRGEGSDPQDGVVEGRNDGTGGEPGADVRPGAGDRVVVIVSDEGEGIAEQDLERLFEPFFTTKSYGTGLGLATVHRIVQAHAGRLDVDTTPGSGTRFRVTLPIEAEQSGT